MESLPLPTAVTVAHAGSELLLRGHELSDVEAMVDACSDPDIAKWTTVPSPYTASDARDFIEFRTSKWKQRSGGHYLITATVGHPLESLAIVGSAGFDLDWDSEEASIGYWVHRNARGHGVASAVTSALCRHLFEMGFQRIEAEVLAGNQGSGATLRKIGFRLEGTKRNVAAGACGSGGRVDMEYYGLIPGELVEVSG